MSSTRLGNLSANDLLPPRSRDRFLPLPPRSSSSRLPTRFRRHIPQRNLPNQERRTKTNRPEKNVMPKDDKPKTKDFEGRKYHIDCKYHAKQWVSHAESECSKNPANAGQSPAVDRRLPPANINPALADQGEDSAEDSQGDNY